MYFLFLGTFFFALNWKLDIYQSKIWNFFHVGQNWKANAKKVKMEGKKDKKQKNKKRIQHFLCEKQKTTDTPKMAKSSKNNYT